MAQVTVNACAAINTALNNVIGGNLPRIPNAGTMYALLASTNYMGGSATPDPTNGLNNGYVRLDTDLSPIVSITHYQPDVAATSTSKSCTAADYAPVKNDFKITMFRQTSVAVSMTELSTLCGDAARIIGSGSNGDTFNIENTPLMEEVRLKIMAKVYKLVKDINTDLLTKISTSFGKNSLTGLTTAKTVALYDANGGVDPDAYAEILEDAQDNQFLHNPIIIGGRKMAKYARKLNWGSASDKGQDISKLQMNDPVLFFKDTAADTVLTAGNIAVIAPDMVKLVTYNKYKGIFTGEHGTSQLGSFTLKEFGDQIKFDLKVQQVDCPDEVYNIMISLYYDVYIPTNVYKATDPLTGVNGLLRYAI